MSALDEPEEQADETGSEGPIEVSLTFEATELEVSVPADASKPEAAAIISAVSAHLNDRQRAAAKAATQQSVEYTDEWTLAARLDRFGKSRRPKNVERGDEWKAAARARY